MYAATRQIQRFHGFAQIYSEEKVLSVFMFSHKINNTEYIIVKFFT